MNLDGDVFIASPAASQKALPVDWDISTRSVVAPVTCLPAGPAGARQQHLGLHPVLLLRAGRVGTQQVGSLGDLLALEICGRVSRSSA